MEDLWDNGGKVVELRHARAPGPVRPPDFGVDKMVRQSLLHAWSCPTPDRCKIRGRNARRLQLLDQCAQLSLAADLTLHGAKARRMRYNGDHPPPPPPRTDAQGGP